MGKVFKALGHMEGTRFVSSNYLPSGMGKPGDGMGLPLTLPLVP